MVEISLDEHQYSDQSQPLLVLYAVVTCLLVGVHLLALMISKCVLSQLEAATLFGRHEETKLDSYIEVAWILSTGVGKRRSLLPCPRSRTILFRNLLILVGINYRVLGEILFRHAAGSHRYDGDSRPRDHLILDLCIAFLSTSNDIPVESSPEWTGSTRITICSGETFAGGYRLIGTTESLFFMSDTHERILPDLSFS